MKNIPDDLGNPNQKKHRERLASKMNANEKPICSSDALNQKQSEDRFAYKNYRGALKHTPPGTNAQGKRSFLSLNEKPW